MQELKLYINGEYTESTSNEWIDILNPSSGEVISRMPDGTKEDAEKAIDAAYEAQKEWEQVPSFKRGQIVRKIGDEMEKRREKLISLLSEEQGKPYEQASAEVDMGIDYFRYMSEWARRIEGEVIQSDRPNENIFLHKRPIGVIGGIVPWNFPVFIFARKVATALIAGCSIVLKPSQQTPNTAAELTEIIAALDLPKGVYNMITGTGSTIGNALAGSPKVAMITMTGGVGAGSKVMEAAAANITKVNLELGGKAPAIVTKNADLDLAVENIKTSRITNAGQACTNAERVYVHESVADEFINKLADAFSKIKVGHAVNDRDAEMGPLVSEDRLNTVKEALDKAVQDGAIIAAGGKRPEGLDGGFFLEPTVLTNVTDDMDIMREEIFGPVLPVTTYSDLDDAIRKANDSIYGLSSSVYTEDYHEAMYVTNKLRFGETFVNRENFEAIQGYHAGMRQSGLGGADGKHGLEDFLVTQVVYMQYKTDFS
ncbi:aldehyde dehydrogenase [Bacillus mangrovi]|uniref:Aldehyde dehydrogenase n=1 Tax=Metabacillus mangrovi TaxID=1491830 RepID=A0A7X2V510_9BACI|nr:aldehyde dehydrogenase [Metabacillus mangrovi]MTH54327.1 aldehyde dehydrogenase [Metabacillus mangrovi]